MRKAMQVGVLGVLLINLAGCDALEQSAQKLVEKTEQAVRDLAQEMLDETAKALNKEVDDVQRSLSEWLGTPAEADQPDEPRQPEQPDAEPLAPAEAKMIET
ncbi:hypothetical protein [uncultured Pseudomonas sp.]|uniref:hypothetical protein n=1 Tax=uncultured Pseudomonas sp. TaxID=114707 RepID=UPI00261B60DE|nr:hypothetical protein [uncultured Pseudomonas sp.]